MLSRIYLPLPSLAGNLKNGACLVKNSLFDVLVCRSHLDGVPRKPLMSSSPRSPSSPPPPPPNYPSHPRPPLPLRPASSLLPSTSVRPCQSTGLSSSAAPLLSTRPSTSTKTKQWETQHGIKKAEREASRIEKEAALQAKRQERIRQAFVSHKSSKTGRRDAVQIVVSNTLYNDTSKKDVLKSVRVVFPDQIVPIARNIANLVTWRRPRVDTVQMESVLQDSAVNDLEDVPMCVFVFGATHYLTHIDRNTLNECARAVKESCLPTHRIVFAISGMDREGRRRARSDVRNGVDSYIVDKKAIQDSYVFLYMEYGIRIHDVCDLEEMAHYLRDVTEAIAAAPFHKEQDFVSASLSFRRRRANAAFRTTVVSVPGETVGNGVEGNQTNGPGEDVMRDIEKSKSPLVRIESLHELGNLYLTMLCLIPGVTIKKAQCIREKFPTLRVLLDAYDECQSDEERNLLICDLRYGDNSRRLGPALSKTIASVLTSVQGDMPV